MAYAILTSVLLANLAQANITSNTNLTTSLPEVSTESLFALQIRQIDATTESPPAGFPGNNLNDIGGTANRPDVPEEISISTIYSRNDGNKKYNDDSDEGNLLSTEGGAWENKDVNFTEQPASDVIEEALPLVWDSCIETHFRDDQRNLVKAPEDMEIASSDFQVESDDIEVPKPMADVGSWKKREAASTIRPWQGKFNSLKGSRSEERRQQKPDPISVKKTTEASTTSTDITTPTVKVVPITRAVFKDVQVPNNVTQKAVATEISIRASYTEDWFEAKDRGRIRFSGLPQRETYLIPALKLEAGFHPFAFMSDFFALIYPFEFPVGDSSASEREVTCAVRAAIQNGRDLNAHGPAAAMIHRPTEAQASGHTAPAANRESMANIVRNGEWKNDEPREEWKTVQRKRLRNQFIGKIGKAETEKNEHFKAAEINIPIYIYNVSKEVAVCHILDYIEKKSKIRVTAEKVNMKTMKEYDSYKIFVPKRYIDVFMNDTFWPNGVSYRRFVNFGHTKRSIHVESTFLAFIVAFASIALVIPSYLFILGILSLFSKSGCDDETETGALFPEADDSDCNDRVLVVVTLFVVLLCCVLISGMAVSNEQAHEAATESRNVFHCACADIAAWLVAAARELHHSLIPPVDLVLHAYKEDLHKDAATSQTAMSLQAHEAATESRNVFHCACADIAAWLVAAARELHHSLIPPVDLVLHAYKENLHNIEVLLGEPIQQAIASESGIELVFDSLADIISESGDLSAKISSLRDVSIKAGALAAAASDRVKDLARQLDNLKKFCNLKDAPLCDTINTNSLELQIKFELILHERQLQDLRILGVQNMTRAILTARQEFKTLPAVIATQTIQARKDILNDIETRRQSVHMSSNVLNDIVRHLTAGLHSAARQIEGGLERVQKYDFWRWMFMLACVVTFGFIMLLIIFAMTCGCGHAKDHGKRTLQVSAVWLCFSSMILWGVISAIFLITGHAEVYVCHALWDKPQYATLTALLDKPSPLLTNNEGIFDALFRDFDNLTIDVSVKDMLRDCENDRPAYVVFQLDKVLDINKETSYFEWEELQADLGRLASSIDVGLLKSISQNFNRLLNRMLTVSDVNLAKYRMDYNGPIVGKDLPSLVDQLQNVAAQVSDLTTAGRLETMATRTKRLYTSSIKPLEQMRADVVYKLTELELQLMPFRRKLNISLSHIHTAQFYIDNQGDVIAQKKVSMYVSRLISHAAAWRTHVLMSVNKQAGRCKPLFTVYSAMRTLLCTKYISSLHGWWFCGVFLGLLWCSALTPLCVRLWRMYGWKIRANEALHLTNLGSGQQETPTTAMCGSNWNTPGPPPAPRSDSW